jgi:hypothetical protein
MGNEGVEEESALRVRVSIHFTHYEVTKHGPGSREVKRRTSDARERLGKQMGPTVGNPYKLEPLAHRW